MLPTPDEKEMLEERSEVEQNLIEIAARDTDRTAEDEKALARERERKPDTFYSDLIYTLATIRYPEDEARLVWGNLLTHKAEMSSLLGRNVGIRVAALDFFRNKMGRLGDVKIIDSSEYIQTAKLAITDYLTGVHNHRYFQDRLARAIERASRERAPVSLLMIDIDRFKRYNDRLGHIAGDVALREVAGALRRAIGREQVVARYGGEEFTVVLFGVGKRESLEEAERLRKGIESLSIPAQEDRGASADPRRSGHLPRLGARGRLTISAGVATFPEDASDRNGLIDWADLSLYLAKTGGRNRVVSCPVDRRRLERHYAGIEARLRRTASPGKEYREFAVIDMGRGGVALAGKGLPASGSRVEIVLSGKGLGEPLPIRARIAWKRAESRLGELAGAEFVSMPRQGRDRLAEWLAGLPEDFLPPTPSLKGRGNRS